MAKQIVTGGLNTSPTIVEKAGATLTNAAMLALAYNGSGKLILPAASGALVMGIALPETDETVPANSDVTVQIKECGYWIAGAEITKGAELMADTAGKAVPATAGKYILAIALEGAVAANAVIPVQIVKSGYKPA